MNFTDTRRWESAAGGGALLRGRRTDGDATIHFLPGVGFCGGVYWPFLKRFAGSHGLFLHDFEGHGESDVPARFSGESAVARRVPQVIAGQALAQPLIGMGHSFGAALTLKVAAQNPGLFKALVLLDPIVFPTPVWLALRLAGAIGRHPMSVATRARRRSWPSRQDAIDHLRGRGIYKGWTEESLAAFVDSALKPDRGTPDGSHSLRCPPEFEAQVYEQPVYPWRHFRKVDCPVLFLYGADSYPFLPPAARLARRANPRVEVRTAPGHHCFMLEDPAAAHATVATFLAKAQV